VILKSFVVKNFRRLKNVRVDLTSQATVFVGANNSGKTSATHIFQLVLGDGGKFSIFDFSADCWAEFNRFDGNTIDNITSSGADGPAQLPVISIDLWFEVDEDNLHRVVDLLPDLDWQEKPVGVRIAFEPRDPRTLYARYLEAHQEASRAVEACADGSEFDDEYKPWPQDLYDYLKKRLNDEYKLSYYKLDAGKFDAELAAESGYTPAQLPEGARIVDSLVRVDFLDAQRYLSDSDARGRAEDLSKRLSRFYLRNLEKRNPDLNSLRALAEAEAKLNDHFAHVFSPTLESLSKLGYPGITNPELVIRTDLKADSVLSGSAQVHYAVAGTASDADGSLTLTLPDKYNGLGFKNLIYMVVEVLDFHHAWTQSGDSRPPVHLVMIEEPESHLHAQLQQVFIRQVQGIVSDVGNGASTQFVITTHSSHIVYEDFRSIRYFSRLKRDDQFKYTAVKNLSTFYDHEESTTREFLLQYIRLTHCDLFFADAAILVEGNVERLLLPLIINKGFKNLEACHLTILEVGGAFAHKFRKLIEFLELTCLVITDLDSVRGPKSESDVKQVEQAAGSDDDVESEDPAGIACPTTTLAAVTSNMTLRTWIPELTLVEKLIDLDPKLKMRGPGGPFTGSVRVAYQTKQPASWQGETRDLAGRTFEDSFALQNLEWSQDEANVELGLRLSRAVRAGNLDTVVDGIFKKVRNLDKTKFALALMSTQAEWEIPAYIAEGLEWLAEQICQPSIELQIMDIASDAP
jgi:predicted ATP-dependent endonuclease of OLD family